MVFLSSTKLGRDSQTAEDRSGWTVNNRARQNDFPQENTFCSFRFSAYKYLRLLLLLWAELLFYTVLVVFH